MEPISTFIAAALQNLLLSLLGAFSNTVKAFVIQLKKEAADDPSIEATINRIVAEVGAQHADLPWHERLVIAEATLADYLGEIGKDVSRALRVSLLAGVVIEQRQEQPTDAEKTTGMQP